MALGNLEQAVGVTVRIESDDAIPDIDIDPERIARVLGNLIINALRYTGEGGQITLQARTHPNGVMLSVADTGSGIPPEDVPYIFDRFYRGDAARQADNGESSLGLAIAKSLVEAHGGDIAVTSAVGLGTTFEVFLPEAKVPALKEQSPFQGLNFSPQGFALFARCFSFGQPGRTGLAHGQAQAKGLRLFSYRHRGQDFLRYPQLYLHRAQK